MKAVLLFLVFHIILLSNHLYAESLSTPGNTSISAQETVGHLKSSIEEKNILIDKLAKEADVLKEALNTLSREKETLDKKIIILENKLNNFSGNITKNDVTIEQLILQKDALINQLTNLRQGNIALKEQVSTLKNKLTDKEFSFQQRLSSEKSSLVTHSASMERDLTLLREELIYNEKQIDTLTEEKSIISDQLEEKILLLSDLKDTAESLRKKVDPSETELIKTIEKAKLPLQKKLFSLEKQLENYKELLEKSDSYKKLVSEEKTATKNLSKQLLAANKEIEESKEALISQEKSKQKITNRKIKELESIITNHQQQLGIKIDQAKEPLEKQGAIA